MRKAPQVMHVQSPGSKSQMTEQRRSVTVNGNSTIACEADRKSIDEMRGLTIIMNVSYSHHTLSTRNCA